MAIFRVNKTDNYTVMSNYHLRDINLSLKAKGLLSVMLSLPDSWKFSINGIASICKESESAINSTLKELKKQKYLIIRKISPTKGSGGRYDYIYDIYEIPQTIKKQAPEIQGVENQRVEIQGVENQRVEIQGVENHPLYKNTNILNTDLLNTNNNIYGRAPQKNKNVFVPPTFEDVEAYAKERKRSDLAKKFFDYYTAGEWKDKDGKQVKSWKQRFITWESRNEKPKSTAPKYDYENYDEKDTIVFD